MNKIAIFNQKGGVGKSSLTINLSTMMYKLLHKKILIIDCDAQANSSSYLLAYGHDEEIKTLTDYIDGTAELDECIHHVILNKGKMNRDIPQNILENTTIDIIPVDARLDSVDMTDINTLKNITDKLENDYDYCFFDCSPQKTAGVLIALCACDYVLVPMDSGDLDSVQGWNMVLDLIDMLKNENINNTIRILGVVVNFYNRVRSNHKYMLSVFNDTFGNALFNTTIRDAADIEQAKMFRQPICYYKPSSPVARDYASLVEELDGRVNELNRKVGI